MRPDVSVLMPVYNGLTNYPPDTLTDAVGSVIDASDGTIELCMVDDASTDETYKALEVFDTLIYGLKIARHTENRGIAAALNTAAEMATGRYIIVQSVRSWYEPGALKLMVDTLDKHPEIGFVYGQTQYHGASDRLHIPPPFVRSRFWRSFDSLFGYMYRREAIDQGCRYAPYLEREGRHIDVSDYDFMMQLIVKMGWIGRALRDRLILHYLYSGEGQMTNLVHKYQAEIDVIFRERWGAGE